MGLAALIIGVPLVLLFFDYLSSVDTDEDEDVLYPDEIVEPDRYRK